MKRIYALLTFLTGFLLTACDKADVLPFHRDGTAPAVTASSTNVAPAPADSNAVALTLRWSNPAYATDTSKTKYVVEIDSANKNFSRPMTRAVTGTTSVSFTAKELNEFLVGRGYAFNTPVTMEARVISSYENNNERLVSSPVVIRMTPYKVPPKVAVPASGRLFIVGSATQGGWSNPVPTPAQELTRIDETTFGGIFELNADQSYLLLPVNGSWDAKFGAVGANNTNNPGGDDFKAGGGDLKAPATAGWYKMIVDFQSGKFTLTPFTQQHGLPSELFLVGDATPGGWSNPVPTPAQQFTRLTSTKFEITLPLEANKKYLILPENGNWGKKFGGDGAASNTPLAGTLKPEGADLPSPATAGTYKITVDFLNNSYKLVKQ